MQASLTYCGDPALLGNAYDHYVHYVLAEKFKKENKEKGWNERDVERRVIQRERQRLQDHRYKFLVTHNYAKHYQIIASYVNAHSYDEYNSKSDVPIDFYHPEWFNNRDHSQKIWAASLSKFAFVPVKDLLAGSKQHPDERVGDMTFNYKYWESTIKDYEIKPGTPESSDRDSDADSEADKSVDLDATNTQRDVENQVLSEEFIYNGESDLELFEE
ncbi:hypothetical protein O181_124742 [Austropuccinia psidii MF-1]|uniref:Uncharacterized protein n=1 Tax=Austropuccinia psidii MF-1 TaxID=1389203 RepID=A0A9Q3KQ71_9BASI|nr:hypothetical protein [Austropuccinia psidii MF-1]